jgi:hypothetical protein
MAESVSKIPKAVSDPRFRAGRRLLTEAHQSEAAIQVFASLLQEAEKSYGVESIETAPVFYEYGNALFRHNAASLDDDRNDDEGSSGGSKEKATDVSALQNRREAAAAAAEKRSQKPCEEESSHDGDKKPAAVSSQPDNGDNIKGETPEPEQKVVVGDEDEGDEGDDEDDEEEDEEDKDDEDIQLSLEMMENAYSILEEYLEKDSGDHNSSITPSARDYRDWAWEQQSRVLTGIGDVLSTMERHADAAHTYFRALELRQERLEQVFGNTGGDNKDQKKTTIEYMRARRLIVESNILIAHEFLKCTPGADVVTTETKAMIVRAAERVDYARGYYETARDELHTTISLHAQLSATGAAGGNDDTANDLTKEKENICYASTMVMDVGVQLARIDEENQAAESKQPVKKKAKR